MNDFSEIRPLTITSYGITERLFRASAMINASWHLSWTSQQPYAVVPIITRTLQVSEILADLPVESWDVNPGHPTIAPTHLTTLLDLGLLTPNPVLFCTVPCCPVARGPSWGPRRFLVLPLH